MAKFLPKIPSLFSVDPDKAKTDKENEILRIEAEIGGQLFGPVPEGHKRYFFNLDEHTWVWHEEWRDNGHRKVVVTRYEVRPTGIIKKQDGQPDRQLAEKEARNLYVAIDKYVERVSAKFQEIAANSQIH